MQAQPEKTEQDIAPVTTAEPVAPVRKSKYHVDELLDGITDGNIHPEVDSGPPVGKELL